jgi:hypothetical protein
MCEIVQPTNALSQEGHMNSELRSYFHNSVSSPPAGRQAPLWLQKLVVGFVASLSSLDLARLARHLGAREPVWWLTLPVPRWKEQPWRFAIR